MQEDLRFYQYVARKLRAWYTRFPPTLRVAAGEDDSDEGQGNVGRRARKRTPRRPMPCLMVNKYC